MLDKLNLEYFVINYRWIFVCCFILPTSFIYNIWNYIRNLMVFRLRSAPAKHFKKVQEVQRQVRTWAEGDRSVPMCTARPGWQTVSFRQGKYKRSLYKIKIDLVDILEINTVKKTVRVEPLVTMGQLSAALARLGWTIPVVPEIDDLTVGGLVMGTGVESSSHRFGLFQHTCVSYELVLSDGSCVTCSQVDNPELFYSIPCSYGTIGFLTAAEIRIIPCTRYVKLHYKPLYSMDEAVRYFSAVSKKDSPYQFVEGIMFSLHTGVVTCGIFVDSVGPKDKLNRIGRWYKPWFFKHVNMFLELGESVEVIPLRDYYHRHTRSIFWELQDIIPFGNNELFRLFFGWLMPPKISFLKLTQSSAIKKLYEKNHMIQDMLVPMEDIREALLMFHNEVTIYPVWMCPFRLPRNPGLLNIQRVLKENIYVDIGVYGVPQNKKFKARDTTKRIENFVQKVNGFQMLYADTYTTREEFRNMFDHTLYDIVRRSLNCEAAFPEVYDKVNKSARI